MRGYGFRGVWDKRGSIVLENVVILNCITEVFTTSALNGSVLMLLNRCEPLGLSIFKMLEVHHGLDINNINHIWLLHYLFLNTIQCAAGFFAQSWNHHVIQI